MICDEKLYQAVGARLKQLREAERYTQSELANKVGLERTSITNIENGNQKLPLHVLYKLCEVFKVDLPTVLPTLAEVQSVDESHLKDIQVGSSFVKVPPLAARAFENIITSYAPK